MHCWNTICVCGPRPLESPSPERKCGHVLISGRSGSCHLLSAGQTSCPPPPPTHPPTATFLLHGSLEGRPMAGNSLSPWSSIVDSVCHSVLTRLWSQAQLRSPGEGRDEERPGVRGWGVGGQRASVTSPPSELGSLGAITHRSLGALRHSASGTE